MHLNLILPEASHHLHHFDCCLLFWTFKNVLFLPEFKNLHLYFNPNALFCSQLCDSLLQNFFSIFTEQMRSCTQEPFGQLQVSQFCTAAHFPLCRKGQRGQPGVGFILLCPAVMYAGKSWLCMAIKHPIVYIKTCKVEA